MPPVGEYDVFLSYARADSELARPLRAALADKGLVVFFDEQEINDFESITHRLTEGVARSKALLALYSEMYASRRACQFELTTAFLAGQRAGDPRERVLVVNPADGIGHIEPAELRDALFRRLTDPDDAATLASLAESVARHVGSLEDALGDVETLSPPWYGVKALASSRFVGRLPSMWRIHSALHAGELRPLTGASGPDAAQVRGMGGIGKTLLAAEYARRFGAAYPGGVFWLSAQGADNGGAGTTEAERDAARGQQLRAIAVSLQLPVADLSPAEIEAALATEIQRHAAPCLWVVDDLPAGLEADEVRGWFAPHPFGKTLLTTRSDQYGALAAVVQPGLLTADEACDLLTTGRMPDGDAERREAELLVADLGYHALAIDVAQAAIALAGAEPFGSFRAALAATDEDELELAADLADALPTGHEPSIAATLSRSIGGLDEEGKDVLRLASALAADPIPAWLVERVFAEADGLDGRAARRRGLLARKSVRSLSLAESTADGEADSVHPLVARTVRFREQGTPARREALRSAAVNVLNGELPAVADPRAHDRLSFALSHARHLTAAPATVAEAELLGWVARYDHERGDYRSAESLFKRQVDFWIERIGVPHAETLKSMNNLAETLRAEGALADARVLQEQIFGASRTVLGDEHPGTLTSAENLALTLYAQGEVTAAGRLEERVLGARERLLGADHPSTLQSMNNLADMLRTVGDLAGARQLQEQVLATCERLLGEEHATTLQSKSNLAVTFSELGEFAAAFTLQEEALGAYERLLGAEHPTTLTGKSNLAQMLHAQGELAGARALQEQVYAARERRLGPDDSATLTSKHNLAVTLRTQGELAAARQLQEELVAARERTLGTDHPQTLQSKSNLAVTLDTQGEFAAACALQAEVVAAAERLLGEDHRDTLTFKSNLAAMLYAQGELESARALQEQVLAARERLLGEEDPATLTAKHNLANTFDALGEQAAASSLREQVSAARQRLLNAQGPGDVTAVSR